MPCQAAAFRRLNSADIRGDVMTGEQKSEIQVLLDRVEEISIGSQNREKAKLWEEHTEYTTDHWRGTPKPRSEITRAPITIEPEVTFWQHILGGFRADQYYQDPLVC